MKQIRPALRILLITNGFVLLSWAMIGPIYALFVEWVGWDLMDASIAWWLFALSAGITTLLFWRISDSFKNKKNILGLWYFIMWFGFLCYLFVDSIIALFLVQIIIGLGEAIYAPAFDALYSDNIHKKQAGYEWWLWECLDYFATAIGAFIGWAIVTYLGFHVVFIIMWFFCLWSAIYLYLVPKKQLN